AVTTDVATDVIVAALRCVEATAIHRAPLPARRLSELHPGASNYSAKGTPFHPHGCTVFPGGHP
ncbi:hypothetical protein BGU76_14165, partial [Clostridioides difficile]